MSDSRTSNELAACPRCGLTPTFVYYHPPLGPSDVSVRCECGLRGRPHQYHHGDEKEAHSEACAWWNERHTDEPETGLEKARDVVASVVKSLGGEARVGATLALNAIAEAMIGTRASEPPSAAINELLSYGGHRYVCDYVERGAKCSCGWQELSARVRAGLTKKVCLINGCGEVLQPYAGCPVHDVPTSAGESV